MYTLFDIVWFSVACVGLVGLLYLVVSNVPTKFSAQAARKTMARQKAQAVVLDHDDCRKQIERLQKQRDEYIALWEGEAATRRAATAERDRAEFALAQKEAKCARVGQPCARPNTGLFELPIVEGETNGR